MTFDENTSSEILSASPDIIRTESPQDFEFDCALLSLGKLPVVLCIGSDRVTGDCLGPIVGQMLVERGANAFVYGTLARPITALNLKDAVKHIKAAHGDKKVLAIDSSVGKITDVGKIRVAFGSIAPGSADGKKLPKVGDVSITATVTDPHSTPLSAVRLGVVYSLAQDIASRIIRCLQYPI
ncbi:MAG: spore protease YyaC [Clostridiales bacterium]|nr:spore protease YyaC [Clostridiales bacterium]